MTETFTKAVVSVSTATGRAIRSGQFIYALVFLGLWGMFVVIDRYVVGMELPYLIEDHETGWFSNGLNWLTLEPVLWTHHPSPFFTQISGLVVSFLDIDGTDKPIKPFANIITALQGAVAIIAGIWFSWASDLIGLNRWHRALLILLIFTFPTLVFLSGHWTHSYVIGLFGLPLGITLFAVLQENINALKVGGIGFGFMAANFYPSALILALFVLTMSLQRHRVFVLVFPQRKWLFSMYAKSTIALLGVCTAAFTLGIYFFGVPIFGGEEKLFTLTGAGESIIFGLALWLTSSFLILLLARADASIERFLLWTVSGFIAGNFILLPWYFHGVIFADEKRKAIGLIETVDRLTSKLLDYPWLLVIWLSVLAICLVLFLSLFGKRRASLRSTGVVHGAVFALLSIIAIALLSAGAMKLPFGGWLLPGMAEKIFVSVIPALTIGWVIVFRSLRGASLWVFQITLVFLSLFSLAHFYQAYSSQVTENKYDGLLLDGAIEAFFQQHPDGRLVCVKNTYY